ncbi:YceI-like domain protein [Kordia sp. SMS9]|uniref:YceI family protein n=1 Tax=Kordia sp. SMS9 TaxID=2282170 RepID=UPI000E0DC80F|nr:YceI family protein [Kordia sp. SMS9]AXG71122.1 YceI-like domain protein [Kordia sp. SMS9]
MNKFLLVVIFSSFFSLTVISQTSEFIERQGQVTFFSYTSVENIQATNNQVLSLFNPNSQEIAVSILMRAFVFKKSLMHEHFNESYIESDLYPKASFSGKITGFDTTETEPQTRIIKGNFTLKDSTKPVDVKATIVKTEEGYTISGTLDIMIDDYNIEVPPLLSPNISKKIEVTFNFNYASYEK